MSWKATAAVKPMTHDKHDEILTAREKLLLFVLADYHNDDRRAAWAGLTALAKASLTSRKHTITLLARLKKRELIAIEARPQQTNLYRLLFLGDPKPAGEREEGGSNPSSLGGGEPASPGVVTSRGVQGSHLASSPEPSFSRQDSKAAPDRGSQDTRSALLPSVEKAERQFIYQLRKLAKDKSLSGNGRPTEPLRAELYDGIYRKKIENVFFDLRREPFPEQLRGCVCEATTYLVLNRTGKTMGLRAMDIERLAIKKLEPARETLHAVQDFSRRSILVTQLVARVVADSAAELLETPSAKIVCGAPSVSRCADAVA